MKILFCAETMGFYPGGLTGAAVGRPAVEVSKDEYMALLGRVIEGDEHGMPRLALPVPPAIAQLQDQERTWRDQTLAVTEGLRDRHRDQLEIGVTTTLTPEQFTELLVYMQTLRDWPQSDAFPDSSARPASPTFLSHMRVEQ